jgi:hypothetical protein
MPTYVLALPKIYQMTIKLSNDYKIYHHFPFQGLPKYSQIVLG